MTNNKLFIVILLVAAVLLVAGLVFNLRSNDQTQSMEINSFEDCVAAGNPVMESYPEQCKTPDGRHFTRVITEEPTPDYPSDDEEAVFCTMDAKVCPDGSSVGRIPPSCEFAPCPAQ